ncbi:unnamed protein product [Parnassius apollo]|uniref:(apollo) hypothetical protein n=1 Tax=Parnassius apollo TaxID=110799 RepID=A0A8S3XNJ9_PARAO|nr:unnamed protein product [Parnassius apollo]
MTSNVFEKFCDTQITYNSHVLSSILNNLNKDFKTCPAQSHDALPNSDRVQIDLTCNEVIPLEELSFSVTEQNDISSSTYALQCGFDSDDSVRDKDYLPSDSSSGLSDDFESVKPRSQKSQVLQTNKSSKKKGSRSIFTPAVVKCVVTKSLTSDILDTVTFIHERKKIAE